MCFGYPVSLYHVLNVFVCFICVWPESKVINHAIKVCDLGSFTFFRKVCEPRTRISRVREFLADLGLGVQSLFNSHSLLR